MPRSSSRRERRTSGRWTCCPASCAGCRSEPGSERLRLQVPVDALPFAQLNGVRVAGAENLAEVRQDSGLQVLGFPVLASTAQSDHEVGPADQSVRVIGPEDLLQPGDRLPL